MIDVIGAPFDLCGRQVGSRLGPAALRIAGLVGTLQSLGYEVTDRGDCEVNLTPCQDAGGMRNFAPLLQCVQCLRELVADSLNAGNTPIVLGGEHTLAIGGLSAALEKFGDGLGVLWIDAHTDIHTPGSSATGNLHGMPIAALTGLASGVDGARDNEWQKLLAMPTPGPFLNVENVAWYAIRDVDPPERERLNGCAITMHDIDRKGVERSLGVVDEWFRSQLISQLWISFDVDVLDPILAPGTGTAVRGGLTYREAHLCAELLYETLSGSNCPYQLAGVDLVETNPLSDTHNETAQVSVEWLASLFGKTILGKR